MKVQSVIRGNFETTFDIMVRQVDYRNMRDVLKEAKEKKWTNMLVDLNLNYTSLLMKMVRITAYMIVTFINLTLCSVVKCMIDKQLQCYF